MLILILQVGRAEPMAAALLIYLSKQHLRRAVPGHLGKLIDGCDQQSRKTAVNFLVDDQHWQAFGSAFAAEGTLAQRITAVDKGTASALAQGFDLDVTTSIDRSATPWAVGQLARRADTPTRTAPLRQSAILPARLFALLGCIGCGALSHPQA